MRLLILAAAGRQLHGSVITSGLVAKADGLVAKRSHAAVSVAGKMYVIAGYATAFTNDCKRYDPVTDTWETIAVYPQAIQYPTAVEIDGVIHGFGGINGSGKPNAVYAYDIAANNWYSRGASAGAPAGRFGHSAVVIAGKMYIFGGQSSATDNGLYAFDTFANSWAKLVNAPVALRHHSAVVIDGKMYVFGGDNSSNQIPVPTLYVFDPATNSWSQEASASTPRRYHSAVTINNKMYVIGGLDSAGTKVDTVDQYDPATDTWTTVFTDSALATYVQSVAVVADKAYIYGGLNVDTVLSNKLYEYTP